MFDNLTSGSVKTAMKDAGAKSADLWMVPIADIREAEGFNVRAYNAHREDHKIANRQGIGGKKF